MQLAHGLGWANWVPCVGGPSRRVARAREGGHNSGAYPELGGNTMLPPHASAGGGPNRDAYGEAIRSLISNDSHSQQGTEGGRRCRVPTGLIEDSQPACQ